MRVRVDGVADAGYVYLREVGRGEVAHMYMTDPQIPWGTINLDFDSERRLIGIEVLPASAFSGLLTVTTERVTYDPAPDTAYINCNETDAGDLTYTYLAEPESPTDMVFDPPEPDVPIDVIKFHFD